MANEAYYSSEHYSQQRRLLINGDPRALVCFCVDVSQSMDEWWIQEGGLRRNTGSGFSDGHNVNYFNLEDILPGYAHYKKIDKLNETLCSLLNELKFDRELCRQVAVSIVAYSRFASVRYDFLDCEALDVQSCRCTIEKAETAMGDGLRTSLAQLDEMQNDLRNADNDYYTPILVFMTDGTPTDDPRTEFAQVRDRVQNGKLFIFPLGIGEGADMARLRDMFPMGKVPPRFSERYKMIRPEDYETIFMEIKDHVKRKQSVMVSEGNSIQSTPVVKDSNVNNNQTGESIMYRLLAELA
jgi:uncharacterized protein YegL